MEKINDIVMIKTELIVPNPYQPRKTFDDNAIGELAQSIKQYGILQPVTVRKIEENYEIIMGERRFRAAKSINLNSIPAIILEVDNDDSAVVALIENLQRVDLSFLEEAESYKKLIEFHGITQNELSDKIGKSQSTISNKLRLLKLDEAILDRFSQSNLTERHARALLKVTDLNEQRKVLDKVISKKLNVKETELLIDKSSSNYKARHQKSTFKVNYKIYLNTIKKAFTLVKTLSGDSTMEILDRDEFMEIIIKIPKK